MRAQSCARAGDYQRSFAELTQLDFGGSIHPDEGEKLARVYALNHASSGRDPTRPLPEREKRAESCAVESLVLLRLLAKAGIYRDEKKLAILDKHPDFASLRDRPDFRAFRDSLKPSR